MSTSTPPPAPPTIDRIAPTRRPDDIAVMRHRWAKLLFLHWVVDAEALRPLVPRELEIDTYEGRAYVGLVPFTMTGVRPTFLPPIYGLSSFHEANVRTYVHRRGRDPGVWFFSLDAANAIAAGAARRFGGLLYHHAKMSLVREDDGTVAYTSERVRPGPVPASCRLRYRVEGDPGPATPGTLEDFLVERYILYARRKSPLLVGRVHHAPYPLQGARLLGLEESLLAAAGIRRPDEEPLVHYAEEVRVRIYPIRRAS